MKEVKEVDVLVGSIRKLFVVMDQRVGGIVFSSFVKVLFIFISFVFIIVVVFLVLIQVFVGKFDFKVIVRNVRGNCVSLLIKLGDVKFGDVKLSSQGGLVIVVKKEGGFLFINRILSMFGFQKVVDN